jgi:DNA-binding response OmpR family regulator
VAPLATKRILLIDDEIPLREIVQTCLETLGGWHVIATSSAQQDIQAAQGSDVDAIILDVVAPEVDGLGLLQRMRLASRGQSIPVILLTAKTYWMTAEQLSHLGVVGAIVKPFNSLLLAKQVATILGWSLPNAPS